MNQGTDPLAPVIDGLVKRGTQRGFLTVAEVQHDLVDAEAPPESFEAVFERLREAGIRIAEDDGEFLDDLLEDDETISVSDPVKMYLQEIGRYRLLTPQQEVELAMQIEDGKRAAKRKAEETDLSVEDRVLLDRAIRKGEQAHRRLTEANLRLVVSIARSYVGRGMPMLDMIQEGNLGLMKAVDRFDYRKGFKFSTYASWWIRQSISRAIADQARTIRVPIHVGEMINKLTRVRRELTQQYGRPPTMEEIAAELDLEVDRVNELNRIAQKPVSLETPVGEEDDSTLGDFVEDEGAEVPVQAATLRLLQDYLAQSLERLSERERQVLILRFGLEDGRVRTLEEVGEEFKVTRERVRQLELKALAKLRHPEMSRKLEGFLDGD